MTGIGDATPGEGDGRCRRFHPIRTLGEITLRGTDGRCRPLSGENDTRERGRLVFQLSSRSPCDKQSDRGRHLIEAAFCRLKDLRRAASRDDKQTENSSLCLGNHHNRRSPALIEMNSDHEPVPSVPESRRLSISSKSGDRFC
jgi:hypothetical protein